MSDFDSLTLPLEPWFDTPLCDLPDAIRQRVEEEFFPMPWDDLSAEQRRSGTLQMDYRHDPAIEQDRKFWWDFYQNMDAIKTQIAKWEAVATPTAGDLVLKETRLLELKQELARQEIQERHGRGDYIPARKSVGSQDMIASEMSDSPGLYIPYPKAMSQLSKRLGAIPEELAAWIWMGPVDGGIAAYLNANELDTPPRFHFSVGSEDPDYLSPLMACWFCADEIDQFTPSDRYLTGKALIERWRDTPGLQAEAYIRAKIAESRLLDTHPIYGGTRGTFSEHTYYPPLTSGLFLLSQVEQIEAEDFAACVVPAERSVGSSEAASAKDSGREGVAAPIAPSGPTAVFLAMENLDASELSIAFVGDRSEFGLGANNMLEVSARKETRRIPLAAIDLVNRRQGILNGEGVVLLGLAQNKRLSWSGPNAAKMKRLRDVFRKHFGIKGDPFEDYRKSDGWVPHFTIADKRGAADERARRDAEDRTDSYEQLNEQGHQFTGNDHAHKSVDDENDDADDWLKENDPDRSD